MIASPTMSSELARGIVAFARSASVEIATQDEQSLPLLRQELAAGTTVYVAHSQGTTLDHVVRVAIRVEASGFRASPHIVARRIPDERALRATLRRLREGGVEQVMLVAGDRHHAVGNFSTTLELLETGSLMEEGFSRIGVCGHPEGNKSVGPSVLWHALSQKQAFADRSELDFHIVTQFGFDPEAVCSWDRALSEHGISLPVHVGIAGPTPLPKLIRFAMQCGVGASLRSLIRHMSSMSNVARLAISPDDMLSGIVQGRCANSTTRIVQPHFYSFGGIIETARWLRTVIEGPLTSLLEEGKIAEIR